MKILLLSLNGDPTSRSPKTYGGAGITLRRLAENIPNAYLLAEDPTFEGDVTEKCISVSSRVIKGIRDGLSLEGALFDRDPLFNFDFVVYANPELVLNTRKPQLVWAVGANETIHPHIKHLLVHNLKWQQPIIQSLDTKVYEFVLGIDIPLFQRYEKTIDIFQCSNHYSAINSHVVANWCVKNEIRAVFAGPIDQTYKSTFLSQIDYKNTFYIGQIDEDQKIKLMKKARCYTNLVSTHQNGPQLSVKQAWSYGCSVIATPMGVMPEVIRNGVNGFVIQNEREFLTAFNDSQCLNQKDCWETANQWSLDKMVSSFKQVTQEVLNS